MKEKKTKEFPAISGETKNGMDIPTRDYYLQLYAIDFHLAWKQIPINSAIQKALKAVLTFYFYTERGAV